MNNTITVNDFLALYEFNLSDKQIVGVTKLVAEKNFNFEILLGAKRDKIILDTIKRINSNLSRSGEKRKPEWNDGWRENLDDFIASNFSENSLIPKYYRPSQVKRWQGNYIFTESLSFEYDFFEVLRLIVFEAFLNSAKEVYEFGCGSPHNLVALSHLFPGINLHGCDWSQSAVAICELLRENNNMKILIYGPKGWIGNQFVELLTKEGITFHCGSSRTDNEIDLTREIDEIQPTHVVSFIGRTHGKIGDKVYSTIDYLEEEGKLVENIRDNLFSPLLLAHSCAERKIHYTYLGTGCIFKFD
jgi:hypothetical protein